MPATNVLTDFLNPNTRYVVLRSFDNLLAGDELTFVRWSRGFDPHLGCHIFDVLFVEKTLRAYEPITNNDRPDEILIWPEQFFRRVGPAPDAEATEQQLAQRQARDRAEYIEQDRKRMLVDAQRRLEKHRRKTNR